MSIDVNVSKQQITANVTDDQVAVTVGGGIGPQGPQGQSGGVSSVNGQTGDVTLSIPQPGTTSSTYAVGNHTHGNLTTDGKIGAFANKFIVTTTDGALTTADYLPVAEWWFQDDTVQTTAYKGTATTNQVGGVRIGSGISIDGSGVISVSTAYAATSHSHGNITSAGAIGSTSGQVVVTTTGGVLTTAAQISSSAVSGLAAVATSGAYSSLTGVPSTFSPSAHKTSHATGGSDALTASDIGAASSSHTHAASDIASGTIATARLGSGSASSSTFLRGDNTWATAGSTNAGDLTTGTLADARLSVDVRNTENVYLWSSFR